MKYFTVFCCCSVLHFSQAPGGVAGLRQSSWPKNLRFQLDEKEKPHHFSQAPDRGEAKRRGKWFLSFVLVKISFSGAPFHVQTAPVGRHWQQHMLHLPYSKGAGAALHCCCSLCAHWVQADTCLAPAPPLNFSLHTTTHSSETAALQIS